MAAIQTTIEAIAEHLGLPRTRTEEVISKLFLKFRPPVLPDIFRVELIADPDQYSGQTHLSSISLTVQRPSWNKNKVKDVASLLTYIKESAVSLIDDTVWREYTGPKAEPATGEPWDPVWVRHYPLPGKYGVYPPSGPAE